VCVYIAACDPHCDVSVGCNTSGGGLCDGECSSGYGITQYGTCVGEFEQIVFTFVFSS